MADVVGSDVPQGAEVRWYAGGTAETKDYKITEADVTAGGVALSAAAEFGSVVGTVNDTPTVILEFKTDKTTAATEDTGCDFVGYAGIKKDDVLVVHYVAPGSAGLKQIAACKDVSRGLDVDSIEAAVHGQPNKLSSVGGIGNTAECSEFYYNMDFVALCLGDKFSGSPKTGDTKFTSKFTGVRKIGALVGKRRDVDGDVTYKWFLIGAQATGVDSSFPTADYYSRDMKFKIDYFTEVEISASS